MEVSDTFVALRPLRLCDAELVLEWRSSSRSKYLHKGATSLEAQIDWMGRRPKNELNLIIECTCGQRAGMLALVDIDVASKSAEAGRFFVDQRYSSRGFAVAAMNLLYRMAFSKLELSLVTAAISTSNQGMISWHQHFGMEVVGQAFASEDIRGNGRSILELELSKIQWEKVTAPKMTKFLQNARERFGHFTCLCGSNENTSLL